MDDGPVPRSFKGHTFIRKSITNILHMASKPIRTQKQNVSETDFIQTSPTTITFEVFGESALALEKDEGG